MLALANVDGKSLNMKFTGPHKILKQTSEVDYLVEFKGTKKELRNLHVYVLKKYFVCNKFDDVVQVTDELSETIDEDIIYCFDEQPNEKDMVGDDEDLLAILHLSSVTNEIVEYKLSHLTDEKDFCYIENVCSIEFEVASNFNNVIEKLCSIVEEIRV